MNIIENKLEMITIELTGLIEKTLNSSFLMEKVRNNSVEHDNGFLKIVLQERNSSNFGFRIHKWKPGCFDSNIHTHRWNMLSMILFGQYDAILYEESEYGTLNYSYDFIAKKNNYSLVANNKVGLKEVNLKTYTEGMSYKMMQNEIHKIAKVGDLGALTAVISWGDELKSAKVYSTKSLQTFESNHRKLEVDEINSCLLEALLCLKNNFKLCVK